MRFHELQSSDRGYYSVGIDEETGEPIIQVTTTGMAWKEYYFRLTAEEFAMARSDQSALDDLAERMAHDKGRKYYADRLIKP